VLEAPDLHVQTRDQHVDMRCLRHGQKGVNLVLQTLDDRLHRIERGLYDGLHLVSASLDESIFSIFSADVLYSGV
jgi:hypothetical protein